VGEDTDVSAIQNEEQAAPKSPWLGKHVPALDGLRGLAILLVMTFHFAWVAPPVGRPAKLLTFFMNFGWTGVDLFFVLSGFLITGILVDAKREPAYFRNFYARRVLRIFPLYYGVLAVTLHVLPHFVPYDTPALRLLLHDQWYLWTYSTNVSVALRHGEYICDADWLRLGVLWSLAVEEHFYLVWPLLVFLLPRRSILKVSVALVALAPLLRWTALDAGVAPRTLFCLTVFRADSLAMGGALAVVVREPEILPRVLRRTKWAAVVAIGTVAVVTARRKFFAHLDPPVDVIGFTAMAVLYGAILLRMVAGREPSRLRRFLSHPRVTFFGKYSYGAYMLHDLLRPAYDRFFPVKGLERTMGSEVLAFVIYWVLASATTFACAFVSFRVYEKPFLELKRFFEYRKEASVDALATARAETTRPGS
jgi:peptidoglycan/LPS O-acetylase OafA/YrhL